MVYECIWRHLFDIGLLPLWKGLNFHLQFRRTSVWKVVTPFGVYWKQTCVFVSLIRRTSLVKLP